MEARRRTVEALVRRGGRFITLVHQQALVAETAQLGTGVLIYPFAVASHEAVLADYVKINFFTCVGHNARLGKYCLLAPYATVNGFSILQDEVYMSTHATVGPQVTIGARSTISANSAITRDIDPDTFVYGVPGVVTRKPSLQR
jgi:acetyltransferase-like isoleucine patch superfamily enzyme